MLHHALRLGQEYKATRLIERGHDAKLKNHSLSTPLHYAAEFNMTSVVKLLLDMGADVSVLNIHNKAPSDYLTADSNLETQNLFKKAKLQRRSEELNKRASWVTFLLH